jgi:zinc-ribbon domain
MFCDQCGNQLDLNQKFCSRCGKQVLGPVVWAAPRPGRVQAHIRLLGILWLAMAAFEVVTGVIAIILANSIFSQWGPPGIPAFLHPLMTGIGIFSIAKSAGGFLTGWGLLNRQSWARPLAIAMGVISLFFHIPFGTALGIYTLWVLLPAHSEEEYDKLQPASAAY